MRTLFKLYLLGQLIALPFLVGAIGSALGGGDSESAPYTPPRTELASGSAPAAISSLSSGHDLCDALEGGALNPVQDDLQQLRYITSELYGEQAAYECDFELAP